MLDLRTLLPLDDAAIAESVKKTGRLLIVHEDTRTGGIAGEIAMRVSEQAFEWLDAPILRVTAIDSPVPLRGRAGRLLSAPGVGHRHHVPLSYGVLMMSRVLPMPGSRARTSCRKQRSVFRVPH